VKQKRREAAFGIDGGKVWAFVPITAMTGEGKIVRVISSSVLAGDDVFDVEMRIRLGGLRQMAILTAMVRPVAHRVADCGGDH
jgi:hypothetical protein